MEGRENIKYTLMVVRPHKDQVKDGLIILPAPADEEHNPGSSDEEYENLGLRGAGPG